MTAILRTAGTCLALDSAVSWVGDLIAEGAAAELEAVVDADDVAVSVHVETSSAAFAVRGWEYLTRGAWRRDGELVLENACTSGFDLHVSCTADGAVFTYRWRPPTRDRIASWLLRSRFRLLARAVLMQYPALWWAGTRGRVPLHATACETRQSVPLVTAAGGVGRSTLVLHELATGGRATADNLAVTDGTTVWGLVEPVRTEGGNGRRTTHGRRESIMTRRAFALEPDCVVVLRRAPSGETSLSRCPEEAAVHSLVSSTYMAGELRRYWPFAATLSAATRLGPPHAPVADVAAVLASNLPCFELRLGSSPRTGLASLLVAAKEPAWA
jgi:hypothetical protein